MLNTLAVSELLTPVKHRARAQTSSKIRGFSDNFAAYIVEKLERSDKLAPITKFLEAGNKMHINRCAWIDRQLLDFFLEHPEAEGIEIEGGLSTRFHRLSTQLEWPKFSWTVINSKQVNKCVEYVFPTIDNFRCSGCDSPRSEWHNYVPWTRNTPKVIVVGEQRPLLRWHDFVLLHEILIRRSCKNTSTINLMVTHAIRNFKDQCNGLNPKLEIVSKQNSFKASNTKIARFLFSLIGQTLYNRVNTYHLELKIDD